MTLTAPNSPMARALVRITPYSRPQRMFGSVTCQKTCVQHTHVHTQQGQRTVGTSNMRLSDAGRVVGHMWGTIGAAAANVCAADTVRPCVCCSVRCMDAQPARIELTALITHLQWVSAQGFCCLLLCEVHLLQCGDELSYNERKRHKHRCQRHAWAGRGDQGGHTHKHKFEQPLLTGQCANECAPVNAGPSSRIAYGADALLWYIPQVHKQFLLGRMRRARPVLLVVSAPLPPPPAHLGRQKRCSSRFLPVLVQTSQHGHTAASA